MALTHTGGKRRSELVARQGYDLTEEYEEESRQRSLRRQQVHAGEFSAIGESDHLLRDDKRRLAQDVSEGIEV
jgi:hypothetical protein